MITARRRFYIFQIEPGEGRVVTLLFLLSFCLGAALNFVQATAFPLFLGEFSAGSLPWVYLINAALIPLFTSLYLRLDKSTSFSNKLAINFGFLLVVISTFRIGLETSVASLVVFALPVLFQVLAVFGNLAFWTLAGHLLNVRQSKRLYGLIGAGQWAAIVLTGFLISSLVPLVGLVNLLLLSLICLAGALATFFILQRAFGERMESVHDRVPEEPKDSIRDLLKERYLVLLFALVVIWWLAFFFVDNIFYSQAEVQFSDQEQMASFMGIYLAILGILTLVSNTFLTGTVINRYGVRTGMLILPVALAAASGSTVFIGAVLSGATLLFVMVVALKLLDLAVGFSIDLSVQNILYQPLQADQRSRARTLSEGVFQPLANGLAGIALLFFVGLLSFDALELTYVLIFVVAAWLVVVYLLRREYPARLAQALSHRRLSGVELQYVDQDSLVILRQALKSPHTGVVVYAMDTLGEMEDEFIVDYLPTLLGHPVPEIRQEAIKCIVNLNLTIALEPIRQRLSLETSSDVKSTVVWALAMLGGAEDFECVLAYLDDPQPQIRHGAISGLLSGGGIDGAVAGGHKLLQMANSPLLVERLLVAQVLGQVGIRSYYQPLLPLLDDENLQVKRAALLAAGRVNNPKLWPLVLAALGTAATRGAAAHALVAGGEGTLPFIMETFYREDQSKEVSLQLIRIGGRIGGETATTWLRANLNHPDSEVRSVICHALSSCGYQASTDEDVECIETQIRNDAALYAETLAILVDFEDEDVAGIGLLVRTLNRLLVQDQERILLLLSFICDPEPILKARQNLSHASDETRAYALELIDVLIPTALKGMVIPVLSNLPPGQKLKQLQTNFPQPQRRYAMRLNEIITAPSERFNSWTKTCALYIVGAGSIPELTAATVEALASPDPLIQETAALTLSRLQRPPDSLQALNEYPDPSVARLMESSGQTRNGGGMMPMSTVEKTIALTKAHIFAETSDKTLAEIASLLEEEQLGAGEMLFEKGDPGNCMFIIVAGSVHIHNEGYTINRLGEGDIFGEMAVLDVEPRMASATAVEDSHLLRLDQELLFELMEYQIEVARGIIHVLSRRLREASNTDTTG